MSGAVRDGGFRQSVHSAQASLDQEGSGGQRAVVGLGETSRARDSQGKIGSDADPRRSNLTRLWPRGPIRSSLQSAAVLLSQDPLRPAKHESAFRKRPRRAARDYALRWSAVFNHPALGVVTIDADGRFLETNRAFQRMTGYTGREASLPVRAGSFLRWRPRS